MGAPVAGVGAVRVNVIFELVAGTVERLLTWVLVKVVLFAVCCESNWAVVGDAVSDAEFIPQL